MKTDVIEVTVLLVLLGLGVYLIAFFTGTNAFYLGLIIGLFAAWRLGELMRNRHDPEN